MGERLIHLRLKRVVNLFHSKTLCGRTIYSAPSDMSADVAIFGTSGGNLRIATDFALATCGKCLSKAGAKAPA